MNIDIDAPAVSGDIARSGDLVAVNGDTSGGAGRARAVADQTVPQDHVEVRLAGT